MSSQTFIFISPKLDAIESHIGFDGIETHDGEGRYLTCLQDAVDGFRSNHWEQGWGADEECEKFCNGWGVYRKKPNGDLVRVATVTKELIMVDEVDSDPKAVEVFIKRTLTGGLKNEL